VRVPVAAFFPVAAFVAEPADASGTLEREREAATSLVLLCADAADASPSRSPKATAGAENSFITNAKALKCVS